MKTTKDINQDSRPPGRNTDHRFTFSSVSEKLVVHIKEFRPSTRHAWCSDDTYQPDCEFHDHTASRSDLRNVILTSRIRGGTRTSRK
jgi:hypothetical protein